MERSAALTWSWLNVLTKKRYDALRNVYGDLGDALGHVGREMLKALGCREDTVEKVLNRLEGFDTAEYDVELSQRGLHFVCIEDDAYPEHLREIPDPPVFLYARGDLAVCHQPCIALVGTRAISACGKRVAEFFTQEFVRAGVVTVSGLAAGIDAQVARDTIAAGGRHVAVLAHGLGAIYPKANARLAGEVVHTGGLLLSEFPIDVSPDTYTFPARNRIIAALALGTVVLEAGEGSGALITADFALEYGRDVFAVPGQIFDPQYAGCNALIAASRARLATMPSAVLQECRIACPGEQVRSTYVPQNPQEAVVYNTLTPLPQSVSDIVDHTRGDAGAVNAVLTVLELAGAAKNVGGGMWVRA